MNKVPPCSHWLGMMLPLILLTLGSTVAQTSNHSKTRGAVLIDPKATLETKALYQNLKHQMGQGVLFGHHNTALHGIGWNQLRGPKAETGASDVKKLTGAYPAVYGWDFCEFDTPKLRSRGAKVVSKLMVEAFERGGINTISWHMDNPVTGKKYGDCAQDTLTRILPSGDKHDVFKKKLDWAAEFFRNLKSASGVQVPVIFRPWHEHTHDGFWWNLPYCKEEQYIQLWRFTVTYLRDTKKVHNLIYAISPSGRCIKATEASYLQGYPGDDYIDILGLDNYMGNPKDARDAAAKAEFIFSKVRIAVQLAEKKGKVAALTETGHARDPKKLKLANWYNDHFWQHLRKDKVARRIAYFMVWRNLTPDIHWVPQPNSRQADGFMKMFKDKRCIFSDTMDNMYKPR